MMVFNYKYKNYPESPKATLRNRIYSAVAAYCLIFGIGIALTGISSGAVPVVFLGLALIALRFYIKSNKDAWTDRIAASESGNQSRYYQSEYQPSASTTASNSSSPSNSGQQQYKYCTYCGAKNNANAKFCIKCGQKIG